MLELYHNDMSTCAQKVRLTLAEKGLAWENRHLDLRAGDQQNPEYLKLNPRGVVPTIVDNGKVVRESTVIMEYLDDEYPNPSLRPADSHARAQMRLWTKRLDEGHHDIALPRSAWGLRFVFSISTRDRRRATP
jgi:glutathione S-transferase